MLNKRRDLVIVAAFVALLAVVNGQTFRTADADPKEISTKVGDSIKLMCRYPSSIFNCDFRIPGVLDDIRLNPAWEASSDNFRYFGEGLDKGQCGVEILRVNESMHGVATCLLNPNDGKANAVGSISIIIAKAPQDPRIEIIDNADFFKLNEDVSAVCSSVDGRPAANLAWFLNDIPLGQGQLEIIESESRETTYATAQSTITLRMKAEYNNARLVCVATHVGFPDGTRNASHQFAVRFHPIPLSEINISGLEIGNSAVIGPITIQANPRPRVQWVIDGKVMQQGDQNERFIAPDPIEVGENRWNVSLQVVSLTLEDTTRSYVLRASNDLGTTDYKIRIGGSSEVAATGLSIVTIIVISIISLLVLVFVALIVVARVTKRWCFAGESMHPNGPDSEAQIAPEDDKTHEHYEQHEKSADDESQPETETVPVEGVKATNGKAKGNTSV